MPQLLDGGWKGKKISQELLVTVNRLLRMYRGDGFLIVEAICWVIYIWQIIYILEFLLGTKLPFRQLFAASDANKKTR